MPAPCCWGRDSRCFCSELPGICSFTAAAFEVPIEFDPLGLPAAPAAAEDEPPARIDDTSRPFPRFLSVAAEVAAAVGGTGDAIEMVVADDAPEELLAGSEEFVNPLLETPALPEGPRGRRNCHQGALSFDSAAVHEERHTFIDLFLSHRNILFSRENECEVQLFCKVLDRTTPPFYHLEETDASFRSE